VCVVEFELLLKATHFENRMQSAQIVELLISLMTLFTIIGCGVKVAYEEEMSFNEREKEKLSI